ncbi:MAG: GGDEF domain-containing protein [Acholeplasmataceae bacterium]|jgi:diguanylate cyclase (GGDEF)-like protein|nr:GGDEF domain-containing protein [Acholeplasmataceae bacterium]
MVLHIANFNSSIVSFFLLIVLIVVTRIKRDQFSFSSRLLRIIVFLTLTGLIMEPIAWFIENKQGSFYHVMGYLTNSILFFVATLLAGIWMSYWEYKLSQSKKTIVAKKYNMYPSIIQIILLVFNAFTHVFFEIDATNTFVQTPFYWVLYLVYYGFFGYLIYLLIKYRKQTSPHIILGAVLFMLLPLASSVIQIFYPDLIFSWPSLVLAILFVYLFLETTTGNIDDLTQLYTRRLLELHLKALIEDKKEFYAIMIDLDHFKSVNDLYGHRTGDQVLASFAGLIKRTEPSQEAFVSRLGGDEFFIVHRGSLVKAPTLYINLMRDKMKSDSILAKFPFLDFSAGYIIYDESMTLDDVLNLADKMMYEEKDNKKIENKS